MKFAVLEKPLKRLTDVYARSWVPAFLHWWRQELLGCLPEQLRARLSAPPLRAIACRQADDVLMIRKQRGDEVLHELSLSDPEHDGAAVLRMLNDPGDPVRRRIWLLSTQRVLRRRIQLPAAAEENLQQILAFEMDRQTPFTAAQVYFDSRIAKRDSATQQIWVDLAVVPRSVLDADLEAARRFRLDFDVADAGDERTGELWGFNFLPQSQRVGVVDQRTRLNWILGLSAFALLMLVMSQHLDGRRIALTQLSEVVVSEELEANSVRELESRVKDAIVGANFLAERKCTSAKVIKVMFELTQRLPNDTWLERISFIGNQVQIQGQSAEANKLIGLLQKAETVMNPQVQGVIQPDPGTGKDRFTVQLDLKAQASCDVEVSA